MRKAIDAKTKAVIILLLVVAAITAYMLYPMINFAGSSRQRQTDAIEQAITTALLQCYALEGSYPPDIDYLSEHYGVWIDHSQYYYYYEVFASNVRPIIDVVAKAE